MKIVKFEEIRSWQMARGITRDIYAASRHAEFGRDFALRDQVRRAAISVMANIVKGFMRGSRKEFARFLHIARGSLAEVQSPLYMALDCGYLEQERFDALYSHCDECARKNTGFIRYLNGNSNR